MGIQRFPVDFPVYVLHHLFGETTHIFREFSINRDFLPVFPCDREYITGIITVCIDSFEPAMLIADVKFIPVEEFYRIVSEQFLISVWQNKNEKVVIAIFGPVRCGLQAAKGIFHTLYCYPRR